MILTLCLLLDDINEKENAEKIRKAIYKTLVDKKNYTRDLGGENTTTGMADAIISNLGI